MPSKQPPGTAPEVLHPPASRAGRLAVRVEQHHAAAHALLDKGLSGRAVARRLGAGQKHCPALRPGRHLAGTRHRPLAKPPQRPRPLQPYLHRRWHEGHTDASKLHAELRERGFTGSYSVVRDYLRRFRRTPTDAPPPRPPGVRKLTGWITRRPDRVTDDDRQKLRKFWPAAPSWKPPLGMSGPSQR